MTLGLLGTVFLTRGTMLWVQAETGVVIQNWITPTTTIPPDAWKWTWGVGATASQEPDAWHFKVFFRANDTAQVLLLWNLNETVLFSREALQVDETFDIQLPKTGQDWRWDWLIKNLNPTTLTVYNFTVMHYPIRYPERTNGLAAVVVGVGLLVIAGALVVNSRRRDSGRNVRR